jgi:hypothetical protein
MPAGRLDPQRKLHLASSRLALVSILGPLLAGCGLAATGQVAKRRPRIEPRDTQVVHENCAVTAAGAAAEDINGDGRPDRRTASDGGRPRCHTLDFNFDGAVDAWVYMDDVGQLRRREYDYDRDGSVDEVSLYRAGVLVEQQRATSRPGKLDTWHYFSAGKVARSERDSNGDDYIDQWWEYPDQRAADCPVIHSDVDGDGQPDPGATVDVCRDRYGAGGPPVEGASSTDPSGVGELPTELPSQTEGGTGESEPAPGDAVESPTPEKAP